MPQQTHKGMTVTEHIIQLTGQVSGIMAILEEMKNDLKAQDHAINHSERLVESSINKYEVLLDKIDELKKAFDMILIRDQEQQLAIQKLSQRVDTLEVYCDDHQKEHKRNLSEIVNRNWQLWMLIITILLTGVAGWVFALLK